MTLLLAEILPHDADGARAAITQVAATARRIGGEFIEAQVTADGDRVFAIVESADGERLSSELAADGLRVDAVAEVRLVGADLAEVKARRPESGYLVEWDLPAGLTMEAYLTRKKEKSPLYAQVPETTFQRTYVREDMVKCLCFYDAPDEDAVRRAREVVGAPVDRLHRLGSIPVPVQE